MKFSERNPGKRNIIDVHGTSPKVPLKVRWRSFLRGEEVLNLRPGLWLRRPLAALLILIVVGVVGFFGIQKFFSHAEVADFYPSLCLGNWNSPANAQGKPETFGNDTLEPDGSNSALFSAVTSNSSTPPQIFCGGFLPDNFVAEGFLKNIGLTLVLHVGSVGSTTANNASSTASSSLPITIPTEVAPATATSSSSGTQASLLGRYLWGNVFAVAFADDASSAATSAAVAPDPSPTPIINSDTTTMQVVVETSTPTATSPNPIILPDTSTATSVATDSATTTASIAASTTTSSTIISSTTVTSTPIAAPAAPPDATFLAVAYSIDGSNWVVIGKISPDNWQNFTATIPIANWDDLKHLQVRLRGTATTLTQIPKVYLDGMLLEVHYDVTPVSLPGDYTNNEGAAENSASGTPVIVVPAGQNPVPTQEGGFQANDAPSFEMNLGALPATTPASSTDVTATTTATTTATATTTQIAAPPATTSPSTTPPTPPTPPVPATSTSNASSTGLLSGFMSKLAFFVRNSFFLGILRSRTARADTAPGELPTSDNQVVTSIVDPSGNPTKLKPITLTVGDILHINLPAAGRDFKPGRYKLSVWVWKEGLIYYSENDFDWGVLVVNFNKSIYTLGDVVHAGFGVLSDTGSTICNAQISMDVVSPSGKTSHLSTSDGTIKRNPSCGPNTVTNNPDYSAIPTATEVGTYSVRVAAETQNGVRQISDRFQVKSLPLFDVERIAPTRIYPPSAYHVSLLIKANSDFTGNIIESVPESFSVVANHAAVSIAGDTRTLSWPVQLTKGSTTTLEYSFLAPRQSPELYKLGPLQIGSWQETRQWQIASDAAVNLVQRGSQDMAGNTSVSVSLPTSVDTSHSFIRTWLGVGNTSAPNSYQIEAYFDTTGSSVNHFTLARYGTVTGITVYWQVISMSNINVQHINNIAFGSGTVSSTQTITALGGTNKAFALVTGGVNSGTSGNSVQGFFSAGITSTTTVDVARGLSGTAAEASLQVVEFTDGTTVEHQTVVNTGGSVDATLSNSVDPAVAFVMYTYRFTADSLCDNPTVQVTANTTLNVTEGRASCDTTYVEAYVVNMAGVSTAYASGSNITATITTTTISNVVSTDTAFTYLQLGNSGAGSTWANQLAGASLDSTSSATIYKNNTKNTTPWVLQTVQLPLPPTVSNITLNGGSNITLTPNASTTISVVASTTDPAGPGNIKYATGTIFRSSLGSGCASNNLNCYQIASSSCSFSGSTSTVTCSAKLWYFAQSTGNASSSFPADSWSGVITVTNGGGLAATATSTGVNVNVLTAINITTSSINYGALQPNTNTGSTNQTTTIQNAGNSSTTLQLSGTALVKGANLITTSSQHYATSSFTFGGSEQQLSGTPTTVSGFKLTAPTSTTAVQSSIFWGLTVPAGNPTGTYSGTSTLTSIFSS